MKLIFTAALLSGALMLTAPFSPAAASLIITPTFGTNITSDPNAAAIEATINQAIQAYEAAFTNPINIAIQFAEMSTGLGQSSSSVDDVPYSQFYNALKANGASTAQLSALASLPNGSANPVNGSSNVVVKWADIQALGLTSCVTCFAPSNGYAGTISLNTSITTPGGGGPYNLLPVVEHEINEVLGLGSDLGQGGSFFADPSAEDLFRYSGVGVRSNAVNASCPTAYFSIDGGKTNLGEFNNCSNGGDTGDWTKSLPVSGPAPLNVTPLVQDGFATPGANPALGPELIALNVMGFQTAPEPASLALMASAILGLASLRRRRLR